MAMSDQEMRELQDPETWDFEGAEKCAPAKGGRSVVSVAFPRRDFARVAAAAESTGQRVSEFIREAAVDRAAGQATRAVLTSLSVGGGAAIFMQKPNPTRVAGVTVKRQQQEPTATAV